MTEGVNVWLFVLHLFFINIYMGSLIKEPKREVLLMLKKILLLVAACLLLLTMPVLAADDDQSSNSQPSAYSQSGECQGGACTWKR